MSSGLRFPKPEPRVLAKARKRTAEEATQRRIRALVKARDGYCRLVKALPVRMRSDRIEGVVGPCEGPSEWAHLSSHRRSRTLGQAPEARHLATQTVMLCKRHHRLFDGHVIEIVAATSSGADGPLRVRWAR